MKPIIASSPEDKDREIIRLRRRNEYLQRRVDALEGIEREHANNVQRTAQRSGRGFAGCSND